MSSVAELFDFGVDEAVRYLVLAALLYLGAGTGLAQWLRARGLDWSWVLLLPCAALLLSSLAPVVSIALLLVSLRAGRLAYRQQSEDLARGADFARAAGERLGPLDALRQWLERRMESSRTAKGAWISRGRLAVGVDARGLPVSIPAGGRSGSHALVLGATGSGKSVTAAWIAARRVEAGFGAVVLDPKGDRLLEEALERAALAGGRSFLRWSPDGPLVYNPYASGGDGEIADKALAAERFTEPHYQRQAQRYLGMAVGAMRAAGVSVTPASLAVNLDPRELEVTARGAPAEKAEVVHGYLDSLTERQLRDLAGIRDRLSILAESDLGRWLEPSAGQVLDLAQAFRERAVVYLRLEADRRPVLSEMLAGAALSDLIAITAGMQAAPVPTVVVIDEFAAIASAHVSRLFARARSAGVSLVLCTHELADLSGVRIGLREQVLANVSALLAHRQSVPESAELLARLAGTRPVWVTTVLADRGTGRRARSSRRRGREYEIHPSTITSLPTGVAAVITPGSSQRPTIARIHDPSAGS